MAIVGLRNVSVLDSSFLRDSHSQSSRRRGDGGRGSTRSSSLLQMWREIEDEPVVSQAQGRTSELLLGQRTDGLIADLSQANLPDSYEKGHSHILEDAVLGDNGCETWSQSHSQNESLDKQEELNNSSCEISSDLGEVERERVRQIFREWMESGARDHASNISRRNNSSGAEWLGETEQERVRIIREWVQMSSQQSGVPSGDNKGEQSAEIGTQIERVRDGLVINKNDGQIEQTRRGIRKLCGRQVLLDMLEKAERERYREVQDLSEHRAVSHFPHRNRIQALLRGRFLRNNRPADNKRSISVAESELGLLRQKQPVSGLREGFLSRKDISGCSLVTSNVTGATSNSDNDADTSELTEASSSEVVLNVHSELSEPNYSRSDGIGVPGSKSCLQVPAFEKLDTQDSSAHIAGGQPQLLETESRDLQSSPSDDIVRRDCCAQSSDMMSTENTDNGLTQPCLQIEDTEHSNVREFSEELDEQSELRGVVNLENGFSNQGSYLEGNIIDDVDLNESAALEGEQQGCFESEGNHWLPTNVEWRTVPTTEIMDVNHSTAADEWPQHVLESEDGGDSHLQEVPELWRDGGSQEDVQNWLGEPIDHEGAAVVRTQEIYFSDDDNAYSGELRELSSRRRVSNLLRSSFSENLDQLIQSYVERQNHAQIEWELQELTPSSDSVEEDLEQQAMDQIAGQEGSGDSPVDLPSSPTHPSQHLWEPPQLHHDCWPSSDMNNQHIGIEWEIINGLRIDVNELQQRMNGLQKMLEACMERQLELQRSLKQEVSAAVNCSAGSSGLHDHDLPDDKSKWDCVRKGLCCICSESNIDSLLYRCGHMCTCLKCANERFESRKKCPMCQAPIVEVIHAYSIY